MVVYHFCFDLAYFGLVKFDFYQDAFWLHFRTFILGQFLFLVGISLVIATRNGLTWSRFLHRLARLIACAGLISAATWWLFGDRMVVFGVLHFVVLASVLGLLFVHHHRLSLVLAVVLTGAGNLVQSAWFDQPFLSWIGMMTHKPATEDYVPLLPWFGVVLAGIGAAGIVTIPVWRQSRWLNLLALPGRHSLLIYMLHQPLLIAMIYVGIRLAG